MKSDTMTHTQMLMNCVHVVNKKLYFFINKIYFNDYPTF